MTAHTMRKLKTCNLCEGLGIYKPTEPVDIPLVFCIHSDAVPKDQRRFCHPQCYVDKMGLRKLLTFPVEELQEIRMSDLPHRALRKVLSAITK